MIKGIDVARYQGVIDWEKVKAAGIKFAMLKTVSTNKNFGGIYIDPTFERNYAECKRLGIPVGVYYYTYAQDKQRADAELAMLKKAITGKVFEYPVVIDVEDNKLKPLSADALTDLVIYAAETIEKWGAYAAVYTYTYYKNTELNMKRLVPYDLWIADYRGQQPDVKHGMWQYTSKGRVDGISGNVDLNWAYKDYPAIMKANSLNDFRELPAPKPVPSEPKPQQPTADNTSRKVFLSNTPLYASATSKEIVARKSGTFYLYDGVKMNGRYRITNAAERVGKQPASANVTGYINASDVEGSAPAEVPAPHPVKPQIFTGKKLSLNNAALYATATSKKAVSHKTGTFYLYDGVKMNGRYRITNSPNRVAKAPAALNVTGYIDASAVRE